MKRLSLLLALGVCAFAQNPATAKFPSTTASDSDLGVYTNVINAITLTGAITNSATAFTISSSLAAPVYVRIDNEIIFCASGGTTLSGCTRGAQNTTAAAHSSGATLGSILSAGQLNQANAEIKAIEANAWNLSAIPGWVWCTAGSGGVSANQIVKLVSDGTTLASGTTCIVATTATTDTAAGIGLAMATASQGVAVKVAITGQYQCIADNSVAASHDVINGTTTAGRCADGGSGQSNIAFGTRIFGKSVSQTTISAGSLVTVQLYGIATTGTANVVLNNQVNTATSAFTLDLSLASALNGLKLPLAASAAPTADGTAAVDSATHAFVRGANGTTVVGAAAGTGAGTTGTTCSNQVITAIFANQGPTCTTVVAGMTDTSIAHTGADINTSFQVAGIKGVPFCTGYTPTNGQVVQYTTASSPNPCYTAAASSGASSSGTGVQKGNGSGGFSLATATDIAAPLLCTATYSAGAYSCSVSPAIASYTDGLLISLTTSTTNAATAPTLNLNGLGAKTIVDASGGILRAGRIGNGAGKLLRYNSTSGTFELLAQLGSFYSFTSITNSTNAYTAGAVYPNFSGAPQAGDIFSFTPNVSNTGAATITWNGGSAYSIVRSDGTATVSGDLSANHPYLLSWDGTGLRLIISSSASSSSGTGLQSGNGSGGFQQSNASDVNAPLLCSATYNSGTNALSCTIAPAIASLTDGLTLVLKVNTGNTAAAPTLNVNGLGAVTMVNAEGANLRISALSASIAQLVTYSAANNFWYVVGSNRGQVFSCANVTNVSNAYLCGSLAPYAGGAPQTGDWVLFRPNAGNTGAATLQVGGPAESITHADGTATVSGDLIANQPYILAWDGTNFRMLSGGSSSGASSHSQLIDFLINATSTSLTNTSCSTGTPCTASVNGVNVYSFTAGSYTATLVNSSCTSSSCSGDVYMYIDTTGHWTFLYGNGNFLSGGLSCTANASCVYQATVSSTPVGSCPLYHWSVASGVINTSPQSDLHGLGCRMTSLSTGSFLAQSGSNPVQFSLDTSKVTGGGSATNLVGGDNTIGSAAAGTTICANGSGVATTTGCSSGTGGSGGAVVKTSSYTIQSSDSGLTIVMNCTSACTATLPSSPTSTFTVRLLSVGSTLATVSLNGKNFNTGSTAPTLNSYRATFFSSDGTNYFGEAPLSSVNGLVMTPSPNNVTIGPSVLANTSINLTGVMDGGSKVDFNGGSGTQVNCFRFEIDQPRSFSKWLWAQGSVGLSTGQGEAFGIYDSTGTNGGPGSLIANSTSTWSTLSVTNTAEATSMGATITLQPGQYWWAFSTQVLGSGYILGVNDNVTSTVQAVANKATVPFSVSCSNVATGTGSGFSLPSTCGTASTQTFNTFPIVWLGN